MLWIKFCLNVRRRGWKLVVASSGGSLRNSVPRGAKPQGLMTQQSGSGTSASPSHAIRRGETAPFQCLSFAVRRLPTFDTRLDMTERLFS